MKVNRDVLRDLMAYLELIVEKTGNGKEHDPKEESVAVWAMKAHILASELIEKEEEYSPSMLDALDYPKEGGRR